MADVEEKPVVAFGIRAEIEDGMEGDRQLNHAKIGSQMPAIAADRINDPLTHLAGQLGQLFR